MAVAYTGSGLWWLEYGRRRREDWEVSNSGGLCWGAGQSHEHRILRGGKQDTGYGWLGHDPL